MKIHPKWLPNILKDAAAGKKFNRCETCGNLMIEQSDFLRGRIIFICVGGNHFKSFPMVRAR